MIEVYRAVKKDGMLCPGNLTVNTLKHSGAAKSSLLNAYSRLHRANELVKVAEDGKECFKKVGLVKQPRKRKPGRSRNNTNIRGVYKVKSSNCRQGFTFQYIWNDEEGNRQALSSTCLKKLEKRVKARGLPWEVII